MSEQMRFDSLCLIRAVCVSAGADVPEAFHSASGDAAAGFCSPEERPEPRSRETHAPQGACEDAAHLRQGDAGRDR